MVRCKVSWGSLQERGLRLDLDKMAFIDRLDNEEADKAIANAAPEIVKQLSTVSYKISVV